MISRRTMVFSLTVGTLLAAVLPVAAKSRAINLIRMLDTDNDGTLDAKELNSGVGRALFRLLR